MLYKKIHGQYIKSLNDMPFEAPVELWNQFSEKMIYREFEKNEIVKPAEQTGSYIDLIIKGSIGVFMWA